MKTYMAKPENIQRDWYVVDASGKTLGRLASQVAMILRGKNKPIFTPFVDTGDHVIIINAEKIHVTGKKETQKIYKSYSGYMGGLKETSLQKLREKNPEAILYEAIQGMLPKNSIGRKMIKKLRVYKGAQHDHQAQQPQELDIK